MSEINTNASSASFQNLVTKAKELSKDGLSINDLKQLKQQAATNDGKTSLNEVLFIRSLKSETNVAKLNDASFDPVTTFNNFEKSNKEVVSKIKDGKIDANDLKDIQKVTDSKISKDDIVQSVKDATPKGQAPVGSIADRLGDSAKKEIGKMHRAASLDGGKKACAFTVSQIIKRIPDLHGELIANADCDTLAKNLLKNGFSKVPGKNFKEGDIVFFGSAKNYTHVGIVEKIVNGEPYMVANSTPKRKVEEVKLLPYIQHKYAGNFAGIMRHSSVEK